MLQDFTARGMAAQNRSMAKRLRTIDVLARGIAENLPKGLPAVIAAPISEVRNAASQIASGTLYGFSSGTPANNILHHYGLYGAAWGFNGSSGAIRNITTHLGNGSDPSANIEYNKSGSIRFATYAEKFEVFAQNQNGFRVLVNGKYLGTGLYGAQALNADTLAANRYWTFDLAGTELAGNGLNLVEVLPDTDVRFAGIRVPIGYTVQPWPQSFALRGVVHGDSVPTTVSDTGADYRTALHGQMPHILQRLTGIPDIWIPSSA
jgi:hypothetical protein